MLKSVKLARRKFLLGESDDITSSRGTLTATDIAEIDQLEGVELIQ